MAGAGGLAILLNIACDKPPPPEMEKLIERVKTDYALILRSDEFLKEGDPFVFSIYRMYVSPSDDASDVYLVDFIDYHNDASSPEKGVGKYDSFALGYFIGDEEEFLGLEYDADGSHGIVHVGGVRVSDLQDIKPISRIMCAEFMRL